MTELSAHLVDEVLPVVPVRQWVLSLPYAVRYRIAWDHELARAILAVFVRALMGFYRDRAKRRRIDGGRTGTVTFIQRFGGALNVNPHFRELRLERAFFHGMTRSMRLSGVANADIMNLYGLHGRVPPEYLAP